MMSHGMICSIEETDENSLIEESAKFNGTWRMKCIEILTGEKVLYNLFENVTSCIVKQSYDSM